MLSKNIKPNILLLAILPSIAIGLMNGFYKESLYSLAPIWFWVVDAVQFVLIPSVALFALAYLGGVRPNRYGFRHIGIANLILLTVLATLIFGLLYEPFSFFFSILLKTSVPEFTYKKIIPQSPVLHLIVVLYFSASAAFVEEIVFRAIPWYYFSLQKAEKSHMWLYIISSSLLFGLIHWENGLHEVASTFVLGVFACVLYAKIKNIWPLVGAHFITDILSFW